MKNLIKIGIIIFLLAGATQVFAADRYWVGGTGNWTDAATHWATSSGGAPDAGNLPTSSDACIFDSSSHTASYIVTVNSASDCGSMSWANPSAGSPTLTASTELSIYGNITFVSGMTVNGGYGIIIKGSSNITTNGVNVNTYLTENGSGITVNLQDNLTVGNALSLFQGTLNTNSKTINASMINIGATASTRTFNAASSTITATHSTTPWQTDTTTGLTFIAGDSNIIYAGDGTFAGGGLTYATTTFTSNTNVTGPTITGANTFVNLRRTNTTGYTRLNLDANQTVTGTLTLTGANNSSARIHILSSLRGTARTITANAVSITNVDFEDITGAGAASWTGTSLGDRGGNTSITTNTPKTSYWVHGASASYLLTDNVWSNTTGGAVNSIYYTLPQDTGVFDANSIPSASKTIAVNTNRPIPTLDFSAVTNDPVISLANTSIWVGSVTFKTGMTYTGAGNATFKGRGTNTITSADIAFGGSVSFDLHTGSLTFQDAFTSGGTGTLNYGSLSTNYDTSFSRFASSNSNVRGLSMGSGTWTLTGTATAWSFSNTSNLTFDAQTSGIKFTNDSTSSKTFSGGGLTYNDFWNATANSGYMTIQQSNTFNDFKVDPARELRFTAGTTQTIASWTGSGTSGNEIVIRSSNTGTHTLTKSGGGTICLDYLNIQHSVATPSSTWYAGANSTNNQAVATAGSGWTFTACGASLPSGVDDLLLFN